MGKKHPLKKTIQDFITWFLLQDNKLQYDMMITGFKDTTELAKFRRQYLKLLNDRNLRELKS